MRLTSCLVIGNVLFVVSACSSHHKSGVQRFDAGAGPSEAGPGGEVATPAATEVGVSSAESGTGDYPSAIDVAGARPETGPDDRFPDGRNSYHDGGGDGGLDVGGQSGSMDAGASYCFSRSGSKVDPECTSQGYPPYSYFCFYGVPMDGCVNTVNMDSGDGFCCPTGQPLACPATPPAAGAPCPVEEQCGYNDHPDPSCPTFATCSMGSWNVSRPLGCGDPSDCKELTFQDVGDFDQASGPGCSVDPSLAECQPQSFGYCPQNCPSEGWMVDPGADSCASCDGGAKVGRTLDCFAASRNKNGCTPLQESATTMLVAIPFFRTCDEQLAIDRVLGCDKSIVVSYSVSMSSKCACNDASQPMHRILRLPDDPRPVHATRRYTGRPCYPTDSGASCATVSTDYGDCAMVLGWGFDGERCRPISGCGCEPDCDHFFHSASHCAAACGVSHCNTGALSGKGVANSLAKGSHCDEIVACLGSASEDDLGRVLPLSSICAASLSFTTGSGQAIVSCAKGLACWAYPQNVTVSTALWGQICKASLLPDVEIDCWLWGE